VIASPAARASPWWVALAAVAACSGWEALPAPLVSDEAVQDGVRVAVAPADGAALAGAVAALTGKQVDLAAAATVVAGQMVAAVGAQLPVGALAAGWKPDGSLRIEATITSQPVVLALGPAGAPACVVAWTIKSATCEVRVEARRGADGKLSAVLAAPPATHVQFAEPTAGEACAKALPAGAVDALQHHVRAALHAAWAPGLQSAALNALRTFAPPGLAAAARAQPGPEFAPAKVSLGLDYAAGSASAFAMEGPYAVAGLALAALADRHPCAVDVAPPAGAVPLQLAPAALPVVKAVARRALVIDRSAAQRAVWAIARAGGWCRESSTDLGGRVAAGWAAQTSPALAGWVDDEPPSVRLWPHSSPTVEFVDGALGPEIEWQIADGTMEFISAVGGVPAVVLTVRGRVRGTLRPTVVAASAIALVAAGGSVDSAVVSSPLAGGAVAANAAPLAALVKAGVEGLFQPPPTLPASAVLPPGSAITAVGRAGQGLWLWLDGGL